MLVDFNSIQDNRVVSLLKFCDPPDAVQVGANVVAYSDDDVAPIEVPAIVEKVDGRGLVTLALTI